MVHNQSMSPISLAGGIEVATGLQTYIAVSRAWKTKQRSPYSDCIQDLKPFSSYSKTLFAYFAQFNITNYDQELCFDFCYQDKLIDKCGCCSLLTSSLRNSSYCQNQTELNCVNFFDSVFSSENMNSFCEDSCKEKCISQKFSLATSVTRFPSVSYLNFLKSIDSSYDENSWFPNTTDPQQLYNFAQQSILSFTVNYDSYSYAIVTENPAITGDQLLGKAILQNNYRLFSTLVCSLLISKNRKHWRQLCSIHWYLNCVYFLVVQADKF